MTTQYAEFIAIDPITAARWLENNTGNYRTFDKPRMMRYAMDMRKDRWETNGESIKFNGSELIDGQHRLAAIIKSKKTVRMLVVRGIESALNIDVGKPRNVSDWLRHKGFAHYTLCGAQSRLGVVYDKGFWKQTSFGAQITSIGEVVDFALKYKESLEDSARLAQRAKRIIPSTTLAAIMFIGCGRELSSENETCQWFVHSLATGESLTNTDAVFHLRNRLMVPKQKKLSNYLIRMIATIAWNKTVRGEEVKRLQLKLTGPTKMEPPNEIEIAEQ